MILWIETGDKPEKSPYLSKKKLSEEFPRHENWNTSLRIRFKRQRSILEFVLYLHCPLISTEATDDRRS